MDGYLLEGFNLDFSSHAPTSVRISKVANTADGSDASYVICKRAGIKGQGRMPLVLLKGRCMLSGELREAVRMMDQYINELQISYSSDDVLGSIKIIRRMQLDDMEKASHLLLMARDSDEYL
ncbi:hypothetical protein Tco_0776677 [Tanacetum coccineum]